MNDFLKTMFIDQAKPALNRHSGNGSSGDSGEDSGESDEFGLSEYLAMTGGAYMFYKCSNLTSVPLFDTSNATTMNNMFAQTKITSVPLFDTSNVTDMSSMFSSCRELTSVPLFDTSNVTDMNSMFSYCVKLTSVPLFDTSNVTSMNSMFSDCEKLTSVPLFDTSNVTGMGGLFKKCINLTSVPEFDTSNVTSMNSMLYKCEKLTSLPEFDISNVTTASEVIRDCTNITSVAFKNIKINLQVGSGTSYGHLLTLDSLIGLCKECINVSASRKLTVGSANLEKLANVYVKFTDPTITTIAANEKGEVEVCESTDEGAMLIETYMSLKSWTLA